MLIALLSLLVAQSPVPSAEGPIFSSPSTSGAFAFFEFAPASGRGMTAACACTTPTGAKGETMTFTRAGDATCSKQGLATTGIADGDLVVCTANQPRVESSGGVLGLRIEGARTNDVLRSQQLENAVWLLTSGGAPNPGVPVVTANAATAPDGTVTADRLDFGSTTGTGFGVIYQGPFVSTAASWSHSVYVKGVSGSGTVYLMSTPGGSYNTSACAFVSTSWSRCTVTGTETATNWFLQIGYDLRDGAQTGQGAQSVYLWQAQREAGAYATSPIPTVAAAVTRNAENPFGALSASQVGSMAATVQVPYPSSGAVGVNRRILRTDSNGSDANRLELFWSASANVQTFVSVGSVAGAAPFSALQTVPGTHRAVAWRTPGVTTANITNGAQVTAADSQAAFPAFNRVYLGVYAPSAGFELDGIITRVCVDPDPTRCR